MNSINTVDLLNKVAQIIFDKKGTNILGLDVRNISTISDFIIIAEGAVARHVIAIAKSIIEEFSNMGIKPVRVEGLQTGDWVVIDYVDFMVHLFMPGIRDKYQLEQLWREGKIIDLKIDLSQKSDLS